MTKDRGTAGPIGEEAIGARLKALYEELEREPLPTIFVDLLEKLDRAEMAAANGAPSHAKRKRSEEAD
ncbi:NepR family anti-sigma factor [Ensifer sp.]|uniref:NepR family anti-sigma factor n=1 Tax=Ensifer sp. TaxID=1872086 RepID=UPI002E11E71B|nr:NepR family anti-sigma factor [Ensifer sp.]